jgi:Collagen triple helix repeat (20 copies)
MRFARRHLSYANIAATLAVVFAMSGGALAASHYLINSTKQINPKVLKALKGSAGGTGSNGATGVQGTAGATGGQGIQGVQGTQGAAGPTGNTGPEGPQGPKGARGPEGGSVGEWTALTISSKLKQVSGYEGIAVRTEGGGTTARLRGVLSVTSEVKTNDALFTLPEDYRPMSKIEFGVGVSEAPGGEGTFPNHVGALLISTDGRVTDPETPVPPGIYYLLDGLTWNLD